MNLSNSINSDIVNEIENEIAKRSHTLDESRNYDIKLNKVSLDELIKKFNNIDFISIFKSYEKDTFFGNLKGMYDAGVYDKLIISYKINDTKETPFDYINLLFTDVEKTKMYVKWRLINGLSSLLSSEIVDIHYNFYSKFLFGQKQKKQKIIKLCYILEIPILIILVKSILKNIMIIKLQEI